jgi:hypothetical protein
LPEVSAQESVNKSFVRVRLYYLYLPMDVCTIFLQKLQNFEFKNYLNHYLKRSDHFLGTLKYLHTVSVSSSDSLVIDLFPGADPEGRAPPKIGKNIIFWRKIVIFHTKYPKIFRASLHSYTNQTYIFFPYEIVEFRIQELFEPLFKEK